MNALSARLTEVLALLAHAGLRRIGSLIALALLLVWIWAAFTGPDTGHRFKYRGKYGNLTTTTYSHSYPR